MKTAVVYARYSSESQTEQSIEGQLRVCYDFAKRNDIVIVEKYIDRAMTGTNDNRIAFQQMMKDCQKSNWDYIIVYKLDRFARNKYDAVVNKKKLRDKDIKLLSAMRSVLCQPAVPLRHPKLKAPTNTVYLLSLAEPNSFQTTPIKRTSMIKGGLNNKVFIITQTRAT